MRGLLRILRLAGLLRIHDVGFFNETESKKMGSKQQDVLPTLFLGTDIKNKM